RAPHAAGVGAVAARGRRLPRLARSGHRPGPPALAVHRPGRAHPWRVRGGAAAGVGGRTTGRRGAVDRQRPGPQHRRGRGPRPGRRTGQPGRARGPGALRLHRRDAGLGCDDGRRGGRADHRRRRPGAGVRSRGAHRGRRGGRPRAGMSAIACVDIGSTYTKAALVGLPDGELLAVAQAPTTQDDVVRGVLAATAGWDAPVLACSSAGGGLRLAVVGYEELISAEAGHRAALSAGARVVHVAAGRLDDAALDRLAAVAPDVVLLVGGTDGGEASVLRHNAHALAGTERSVPVVLAGNAAVRDEVAAVLRAGGLPVSEADNVLPDIGLLEPESARAAIRAVFLEHVIGGSRLSTDPRLRQWVRA